MTIMKLLRLVFVIVTSAFIKRTVAQNFSSLNSLQGQVYYVLYSGHCYRITVGVKIDQDLGRSSSTCNSRFFRTDRSCGHLDAASTSPDGLIQYYRSGTHCSARNAARWSKLFLQYDSRATWSNPSVSANEPSVCQYDFAITASSAWRSVTTGPTVPPQPVALTSFGANGCTSASKCGRCAGDCDSDADCQSGLKCFMRSGRTSVPGCKAGGVGDISDHDYCIEAPYSTFTAGSCASNGATYITSLSECSSACAYMNFYDKFASNDNQRSVSFDPPYCYYEGGSCKWNSGTNTGKCSTNDKCLCKVGSTGTSPTPAPTPATTTLAPMTFAPTMFPQGVYLLTTVRRGVTVLEISPASATQFVIGDAVVIAPNTVYEEDNWVAGIGSIILRYPLKFSHSSGTIVQKACYTDTKYLPVDMAGQARTKEFSAFACQSRCLTVAGCAHFSWWADGGCHLQDASASATSAASVTAGPPTCILQAASPATPAPTPATPEPEAQEGSEYPEWLSGVLGAGCCCCCLCCWGNFCKKDANGEYDEGKERLLTALGLRGRTDVPMYWANAGADLGLALDKSNAEFFDEIYPVKRSVKESLEQLMNDSSQYRTDLQGFHVVRAVRVEDAAMWAAYQTRAADIQEARGEVEFEGQGCPSTMTAIEDLDNSHDFAHNLEAELCEAYLWHATNPEAAMKIAEDGFNTSFKSGTRFGPGGYFAEDAGKSDGYSKAGTGLYKDCYAMLLCRVVLGKQCHTTAGSANITPDGRYDSTLAEPSGEPREFIVYHDDQVYPEYAIVYSRGDPEQLKESQYWDDDYAEAFNGILPAYWRNALNGATGRFDEMFPALKMQDVIQTLFDETWSSVYTRDRKGADGQKIPRGDPNGDMPEGLTVLKVLRVEDSTMWQEYIDYQNEIRQRRYGNCSSIDHEDVKTTAALNRREKARLASDVNEVYLFHGSNPTAVISIAEDGFRIDLSGSSTGQMFGKGAYFSECASKADEYSADEPAGYYKGYYAMLLCRVTLGEVQILEDPDQNAHHAVGAGQFYDSTLGDRETKVGTYREFILPCREAVYPEYAIIYERNYRDMRLRGLGGNRRGDMEELEPLV